ncbi:MAG: Alpha/beta hydrolase fold-3 domain protein [Bryobacterales bacterium]|nr:Alpha/beta hydrolase fold-3 domain protein [Bryobacterales bacterium]
MIASGKSFENIEYSHPGSVSLAMDAYVPDGSGPFPAAIIVHGGAWVTGDRRHSVEPLFAPLAEAGFAWFSISYRLVNVLNPPSIPDLISSATTLTDAVTDVRTAIAYVREHAAEFHIDPERIALIGESAGAQLASMAALRPGTPDVAETVQGVIAFYGPSDLPKLVQTSRRIPDSVRRAVRGSPFEAILLAGLRDLSPINWVRKEAPPFLLIHGTADGLVPFEQSEQMCEALKKAGADCELHSVPGGGHGLRWWELSSYKTRMIQWLTERMKAAELATVP